MQSAATYLWIGRACQKSKWHLMKKKRQLFDIACRVSLAVSVSVRVREVSCETPEALPVPYEYDG